MSTNEIAARPASSQAPAWTPIASTTLPTSGGKTVAPSPIC